jgi:hypothetical protein
MKKLLSLFLVILLIPCLNYPQKKSKKDIIISNQIPATQLKILSTAELLEQCLTYPYIADVMFSQNIPLIFHHIRQEFNGFNELFVREDVANVILNSYLNYDFEKINKYEEDYEKGLYVFKFCYINLLLAQNEIINSFSDNYKILGHIIRKYSETNEKNLSAYGDLITINFVGHSMLKYLENTELGKSSELLTLVSNTQSMNISTLDFTTFNSILEFVTTRIEGK